MKGLGLPSGPSRPPLGRMTRKGVEIVRNALKEVYEKDRGVFGPLQEFYGIHIDERLSNDRYWK